MDSGVDTDPGSLRAVNELQEVRGEFPPVQEHSREDINGFTHCPFLM